MDYEEKNKEITNYPVNSALTKQSANDAEDTIDLVELFYLLLGHIWQIILVSILCGGIALAATMFLIKPTYESTSKIYVVSASNNSAINLSDLQIGSQLTSDYQELLLSRPILQDVITNLDLKDITYKDLAEMITITNASDTRILEITVTTTDADLSADIANEVVNQATIYLPRVMETDEPNLVEAAIPAEMKSGPSYSKNTLIGALIGAVIVSATVIIRFLMNDTLVTPDDIENYLGLQPLAAIPEARYGKKKKKKGKTKGGKQ